VTGETEETGGTEGTGAETGAETGRGGGPDPGTSLGTGPGRERGPAPDLREDVTVPRTGAREGGVTEIESSDRKC